METDQIRSYVKRAKSEIDVVIRGLSSLPSYVDMKSQYGAYVYNELNSLKSKLNDAETQLRRAIRDLDF